MSPDVTWGGDMAIPADKGTPAPPQHRGEQDAEKAAARGKEIRIVASPEAAATIAGARYLLEKGTILSKPDTLDRIITDWKRLRKAEGTWGPVLPGLESSAQSILR